MRVLGVRLALGVVLAAALARPAAATLLVPDQYPTIQAALDAAQPGDTVSVRDPGTPYFERIHFPRSGLPGAPIVLQASPGDRPIIDATGVPGRHVVLVASQSYVQIVGFEIRNDLHARDSSGIRVEGSGSHIEIRDNVIHDIRGRNAMGITVYGTEPAPISDLVIDGNVITDCDPFPSEALTLNGNVTTFQVTNNTVRDVNNIGIDLIGGETDIQPDPTLVVRNGVVRGNLVVRANEKGGGFAGGIYVDGGRDIVVENNLVTESDLGIEVGAENAGIVATNVTVRNNVLVHNVKAGIVFGGFAASVGRVTQSRFVNNTLYENDVLGTGFGEIWIQFAENNTVANNLVVGRPGAVLVHSEDGNVANVLDSNLWYSQDGAQGAKFLWNGVLYTGFAAYQAASGQDAASIFADPLLRDPAGGDFHLLPASPAVDAGAAVAGVGGTDLDGAARPSGPAVDLGADEQTCGNAALDPGETCDDGNLVDGDGCDGNCTPTGCGNGVVTAGEGCDDGNLAAGDCCSPSCQPETPGASCDDGDPCTTADACDGAGLCVGAGAPAPSCRDLGPGRASLLLRDRGTPGGRQLRWQWRGAATAVADFGDPRAATGYTLCLYDASASPEPRLRLAVPAGQRCAGMACWRTAGSNGYRYRDRYRTPDGVKVLRLKAGADGRARIVLKAQGAPLLLPALPLTVPVTVQLHNDAGACWQASFTTAKRADAGLFKAAAP